MNNRNIVNQITEYILITFVVYIIINRLSLSFSFDNLVRSAFIGVVIETIWSYVLEKFLWKCSIIRSIFNIITPIIYGRWEGYVKSSFDNFKKQFPVALEIFQTYSTLKITYYDERAVSHTIASRMIIEEGKPPQLLCIYRNEPYEIKGERDSALRTHYGAMILTLLGNDRLKGIYFNNPVERNTYGKIYLKFKSRELKGTFNGDDYAN